VTVECDQWLALLDELFDGDAADVHVKRHVIDHASVEGGPVKAALIRR